VNFIKKFRAKKCRNEKDLPVRKQNGGEYSSLDEMMGAIGREPHGAWLAGTNGRWHCGIHVSTNTVRHPSSLVLVKSVCQPGPQNARDRLKFVTVVNLKSNYGYNYNCIKKTQTD